MSNREIEHIKVASDCTQIIPYGGLLLASTTAVTTFLRWHSLTLVEQLTLLFVRISPSYLRELDTKSYPIDKLRDAETLSKPSLDSRCHNSLTSKMFSGKSAFFSSKGINAWTSFSFYRGSHLHIWCSVLTYRAIK